MRGKWKTACVRCAECEMYFQQSNGKDEDLDLRSIAAQWIKTGKAMMGKN
jgi:hypothetical protein